MNNEIKVSLTIELEGSTLVRKSTSEVINWSLNRRDLNPSKTWKGKDGLEPVKRGSILHTPYNILNAHQHINICIDTYNYMCSMDACPIKVRKKNWQKMNKKARLEYHLQEICDALNGTRFSYEILED